MISILDTNGNVITSEVARNIFVSIAQPNSPIVNLKLLNSGDTTLNQVGVYLVPATNFGEINHFVNKTPDEFYNEILSLGSQDEPSGLKLYFNNNNESQFFNFSNGSVKQNKIIVGVDLEPNNFIQIGIQFVRNTNLDAEIIYIGMDAE